jgi:hypothetical protein
MSAKGQERTHASQKKDRAHRKFRRAQLKREFSDRSGTLQVLRKSFDATGLRDALRDFRTFQKPLKFGGEPTEGG